MQGLEVARSCSSQCRHPNDGLGTALVPFVGQCTTKWGRQVGGQVGSHLSSTHLWQQWRERPPLPDQAQHMKGSNRVTTEPGEGGLKARLVRNWSRGDLFEMGGPSLL